MKNSPLAGLKVLELARILAGPWAGQILADLGADVVKVESPVGDDTRSWGPPFITRLGQRNAAYFHACNRGKRSIVADLKTTEGCNTVRQLATQANIIIENFKVGGLKKYHLDYDSIKKINPSIIYCSITGFGQSGPDCHRPGYDFLIQGISGIMSITGETEGEPQKIGVAFSDIFTGLYAVIAIQAALQRQQTDPTKGEYIDVALLDSMVGVMANQAMNYLTTGIAPKRIGNHHPNICPYQVFSVSDGQVIVAVGNDTQFKSFCELLSLSELICDSRFSTNENRVNNREELTVILKEKLQYWSLQKFLQATEEKGIATAAINTLKETFSSPQVRHRKIQINDDENNGVRLPILFSEGPLISSRPPPNLGEHTQEIIDDWLR